MRANQVFGMYDGVARSLLRPGMIERDGNGCFTGKDVTAFASGRGGKELLRDEPGASAPWRRKRSAHGRRRNIAMTSAR